MLNSLILVQLLAFFTFGLGQSDLSIFFLAAVVILYGAKLKLRKSEVSSLVCIVLILILYLVQQDTSLVKLLASMILILVVYSIANEPKYKLSTNTLILFTLIWFFAVIATLIQRDIFSIFMYRVGSTADRGVSGLTAEPSLLGTYSAMYFGILSYSKRKLENSISSSRFIISKEKLKLNISLIMMGISVLLSTSMYAYIFFFAILVYQRYYKLVFALLLFFISTAAYFVDSTQRIFVLAQYILTANFEKFMDDASIGHRLNSFNVLVMPSSYETGKSLSAGLSPLIYLFGFLGHAMVFGLLIFFKPFNAVIKLCVKSIALTCTSLVMLIVGPITIIPFWIMVALERRRD